jgi:type II secretory pathway pseudopilin PulG
MTRRRMSGFTLTELAIALVIMAFLIGGVVVTLESQIAARNQAETRRVLDMATEAVIGFAVQNGRLPCPATNASLGEERRLNPPSVATPVGFTLAEWIDARGECEVSDGFLPATTLGITPVDSQGYAVDAWGSNVGGLNRIRYAVAQTVVTVNGNPVFAFTGKDALKKSGFLAQPDLNVCNAAPITPAQPTCQLSGVIGSRTPAVIYSLGPNGATAAAQTKAAFEVSAASADERENYNSTVNFFVARPPTPAGANEFDDIVTFVSPNVLYNRMVAASPL